MNEALQVLVVDDEPQLRQFVAQALSEEGWEVTEAESAEHASSMLREKQWPAVFCDVMLGGADGFSVLRQCREELPRTKVVLMTGFGSAAGALDATAFGAYDYLLKPFGIGELQTLSRQLREHVLDHKSRRYAVAGTEDFGPLRLLGRSSAFIKVMKQVGRLAPTNLPVLLTGETGTGKEVVAAALHERSPRADKPFVAVNCGAIPAELIESELFGHVKGSFTGADRDRLGLWEEADGGTVFLDEITETTSQFQVKLLRALQEGHVRRVGSNQTTRVNVRVIAASNRNVEQEVEAGRFRKDLLYRLNAVSIALPPLRERREDIAALAIAFAERVYSKNSPVRFSGEALDLLQHYPWPGNIRELENTVVRAVAMCDGTVRKQDLPERLRNYSEVFALDKEAEDDPTTSQDAWPSLATIEARYVARVLGHTEGNKQAAARVLQVDRKTLDRMIKRHQIVVTKGA